MRESAKTGCWRPVGWSGSTFRVQLDHDGGRASLTFRHVPPGSLAERVTANKHMAVRLCAYIARYGVGAALEVRSFKDLPDA